MQIAKQSYDRGDPVWINLPAMLTLEMSPAGLSLAMALIHQLWWPTRQPFAYDPEAMARRLKTPGLGTRDYRRLRREVACLFVVLDDGRWAPSPAFFSVTDADAEKV